MSKAKVALRQKNAVLYGLELYGYLTTQKLRKNIDIFEFENSFISKYKAYKDYKLLEKNLKDDNLLAKKKIIIKLL